ncbi:hypothetical protein M8J76_016282 [Diaphorina citri]|nr:hypothetical protein M8J76_016282 [Diaphorina citri]
MNIATIEHWVLQSMSEAKVSLKNGEVPVGCLFIIQSETLARISKQNEQEEGGNPTKPIQSQKQDCMTEAASSKPTVEQYNGPSSSLKVDQTSESLETVSSAQSHDLVDKTVHSSKPSDNEKVENMDITADNSKLSNTQKREDETGDNMDIIAENSKLSNTRKRVHETGDSIFSENHKNVENMDITANNSEPSDTQNVDKTRPSSSKNDHGVHKVDTVETGNKLSVEKVDTAEAGKNSSATNSGGYVLLARGMNEVNATKNATRHAEMVCIDHIVRQYPSTYRRVFESITVIVNVEPCIMCMAALLSLNIRTIVFACSNDRFGYNVLGSDEKTNYIEIVENTDDNTPKDDAVIQNIKVNSAITNPNTPIEKPTDGIMAKGKFVSELEGNGAGKLPIPNVREVPIDTTQQKISLEESNETQLSETLPQTVECEDRAKIANAPSKHAFEFVMNKDELVENVKRQEMAANPNTEQVDEKLDQPSSTSQSSDENLTKPCISSKGHLCKDNLNPQKGSDQGHFCKQNRDQLCTNKQYRLCFPNGYQCIVCEEADLFSVIARVLDSDRMNLCHVFRYKKYEADTLNILKLFYKGVNPNAPKDKVKIRK